MKKKYKGLIDGITYEQYLINAFIRGCCCNDCGGITNLSDKDKKKYFNKYFKKWKEDEKIKD